MGIDRNAIRWLAVLLLGTGAVLFLTSTVIGKPVAPMMERGSLILGVVLVMILFRGWGQLFVSIGNGLARTGRFLGPQVQVARNNVTATVAFITLLISFFFLGFAVVHDSKSLAEASVLTLVVSVVFWIIHFGGVQTFSNHWRGFWLMLSIFGGLYSWAFDYGGNIIGAFAVSAVIAGLVVAFGEEAVLKSLWATIWWVVQMTGRAIVWLAKGFAKVVSDLLAGKYGKDVACFTGALIALAVGYSFAGTAVTVDIGGYSVGAAFVAMTAAVGLFIASVVLGAKKHLVD